MTIAPPQQGGGGHAHHQRLRGCHAGGAQRCGAGAARAFFQRQDVQRVEHRAGQGERIAQVPRLVFMEHQRHARKRHGACRPQLPAIAAAQRQHGNQGHHQHVQPGHKRVAVAAGARQPLDLQPEREEQQQTQRRAPAPFIAVHAQPQWQQHHQRNRKAQPDDLQRIELR